MVKLPKRSLFFLVPAVAMALGARPAPEEFTAMLTGAAEVPAVETAATGTATVTIDGNKLTWHVEVKGIDNPTMAHIHGAAAGENGGVLVPLFKGDDKGEGFSGVLTEGSADVDAKVIDAIKAGNAYVNVHSKGHPRGELRGQLKPAM